MLGVVLLIVDALRERQGRAVASEASETHEEAGDDAAAFVDYPEEVADEGDQEPKSSEEVASTDASEESAVPADGTGEDSAK